MKSEENLKNRRLLGMASGDKTAFEQAVFEHQTMVYNACIRMLGNEADAEDASQAVFMVLLRKAGKLSKGTVLGGWLYRAAQFTCREYRRALTRRKKHEQRAVQMKKTDTVHEGQIEELRLCLDEVLAELPARYRDVIVLCSLEGRTAAEAAREMGIPESTVTTRLARGRKKLKKRFGKRGIIVTAPLLSLFFTEHAAAAAVPSGLTASLTGLSAGGAAAATVQAAAMAHGAVKAMLIAKIKAAAASAVSVLAVLSAAVIPAAVSGFVSEPAIMLMGRTVRESAWSADSGSLAYIRYNRQAEKLKLWKSDSEQKQHRRIVFDRDSAEIPERHFGGLTWHPSGRFLAFYAQHPEAQSEKDDISAVYGVNSNLWVLRLSDGRVWNLTGYPVSAWYKLTGVSSLRFSPDGKRLVWSELVYLPSGDAGLELGGWQLAAADFSIDNDVPVLGKPERFEIGTQACFVHVNCLTPGGSGLLISCNPDAGQAVHGLDIYELDLDTRSLTQLTDSPTAWDSRACFAASGNRILWVAGRDFPDPLPAVGSDAWKNGRAAELWCMDSSGAGKKRVTFFTENGHPDNDRLKEEAGNVRMIQVSDFSCDPGGRYAACTVSFFGADDGLDSLLVRIDLNSRLK